MAARLPELWLLELRLPELWLPRRASGPDAVRTGAAAAGWLPARSGLWIHKRRDERRG